MTVMGVGPARNCATDLLLANDAIDSAANIVAESDLRVDELLALADFASDTQARAKTLHDAIRKRLVSAV